jgi:hypothetical protein
MTPAERTATRKAEIDAIQQEVLLAGHDAKTVVKKLAVKLTPAPTEPSTISPRPTKTTNGTPAKPRPQGR